MRKILLLAILSVAFYACNSGGGHDQITDDQIFRQAISGTWLDCSSNDNGVTYTRTEMISEYGATASSGMDKFGVYSDSGCTTTPLVEVEIYFNDITTGAITGETDQSRYIASDFGNAPKINFVSGSSYIKVYDAGWHQTFVDLGDYAGLTLCPSAGCDWYDCTGKNWISSPGTFPVSGRNFYGIVIVNPDDNKLYVHLSGGGLFDITASDPNSRGGDGSFDGNTGMTKE